MQVKSSGCCFSKELKSLLALGIGVSEFKEGWKGFLVAILFVKRWKITKKDV